jgi:hypothetical protein
VCVSATSANGDMKKSSSKSVDRCWLELSQAHGGCQTHFSPFECYRFCWRKRITLLSLGGRSRAAVEIILKANPEGGSVCSLQSLMETVVMLSRALRSVILKSLFHLDRDLEVEGPDPILLGRLRGRVVTRTQRKCIRSSM